MKLLALACLLLVNCVAPSESTRVARSVVQASAFVTARAATGDPVTDRDALQDALDAGAGGTVSIPNGTYVVAQAAGRYGCLFPRAHTRIVGESRDGTVLQAAPGIGPSVQLLWLEGAPDVAIEQLTLDGDREHQQADQHKAGLFAKQSPRLVIRHVTSRNFPGDGFEIYDGSDDPDAFDVRAEGNGRNGLTLGGGTTGGMFAASQFVGNGAEQFDSEGAPVHDVTIRGCLFDSMGVSDDYVLTMTGMGATLMSHGWTVTDNVVNGSALMVWIVDVMYARNVGTNNSGLPSVRVYRTADRIRIQDNVLRSTSAARFDDGAMVYVTGTGIGQAPGDVVISGNRLTSDRPTFGISAICATDVSITDNQIIGAGTDGAVGAVGVFVRVTKTDVPVHRATVRGNQIVGFGSYSVMLGGIGTTEARIDDVSIVENEMDRPLYLGDDWNTARRVTVADNLTTGGEAVAISRAPGGVRQSWSGGSRWIVP